MPEGPDARSPDGPPAGGGVEVTLVTMVFDTAGNAEAAGRMLAVLAKYVVVSRQHPGCRNIDLCQSVTTAGRYVVIEKWASPEAQRAHFDSPEMVEMARSCQGLLARKPDIDLLEGLSAHDLR
ncbi:MAG TPA: antibiotic biosynthesis monooxygenase family protein [Acidimicrobiales bacterium]|nr:antibiotic biosynthesis monooxygenase family protein [Acidimicrobiales bacterium]